MFEVLPAPASREEIVGALARTSEELVGFLDGFTDEAFFAPQGRHWSPAGHLRHLSKSVRAVARGMQQPKVALLVFGLAKGGSRSYDEVVDAYREALEGGGQAGRYSPAGDDPERHVIMAHWQLAGRELRRVARRWSESALDRYRLPHPLLGKLSVREMLFFTVYHNAHHARRIRQRALGR